jgi:hypothetical protein
MIREELIRYFNANRESRAPARISEHAPELRRDPARRSWTLDDREILYVTKQVGKVPARPILVQWDCMCTDRTKNDDRHVTIFPPGQD